jgi:nucleoid-associated protein YejK
MNVRTAALAVSGALLSAGLVAAPAAADESCRSSSEVRGMVAAFVTDIRDDVKSHRARSATKKALVQSMRTFRGERAETAAERRELGEQISTLARRQKNTPNGVEKRALAAAVLALVEQRERGRFTAAEQKELRGSIAALRRAINKRADNAEERAEISAAIRQIVQQYTCTPA